MRNDIAYYLWLTLKYGQCQPKLHKLLEYFGGAEEAYRASEADYRLARVFTAADIRTLSDKSLDPAERMAEKCIAHNIDILTAQDEKYPPRLKEIYNPPVVLYTKGALADTGALLTISIVGARSPKSTGLKVADRIAKDLARSGVVIVSGLAYGIDAAAHRGALIAGGKTIALLPGGLDAIYPAEHSEMAEFIMSSGGLISEYPPGTRPYPANFQFRNRLISGIASGVIVIEAAEKSGTMLTARHAIEQNRDIFVVPGDVFSSAGSNGLLKAGAKPVTCALDVIEEYVGVFPEKIQVGAIKAKAEKAPDLRVASPSVRETRPAAVPESLSLTDEEKKVLEAIRLAKRANIDVVSDKTGLAVSQAAAAVMTLTVKSFVEALPGGWFAVS